MEAARGLARLRLANLTHVHTFRRGESASVLRRREKVYYHDAREAHMSHPTRFGRSFIVICEQKYTQYLIYFLLQLV